MDGVCKDWYTSEVFKQLEDGKHIELVDIKLRLSIIKPLHANWIIEFYKYMTTPDGQNCIFNGWEASGIDDAIRLGTKNLPLLDPFQDIDPVMDLTAIVDNLKTFLTLGENERGIACSNQEEEEDNAIGDEAWIRNSGTNVDELADFVDEYRK